MLKPQGALGFVQLFLSYGILFISDRYVFIYSIAGFRKLYCTISDFFFSIEYPIKSINWCLEFFFFFL